MMRPSVRKTIKPQSTITELKRAISQLRKEADEQLSLEYESQQNFEFLASQVRALRHAFSTLSDVLVEEVDTLRAQLEDNAVRHSEDVAAVNRAVKAVKTETTLLRADFESNRESTALRLTHVEDTLSRLQGETNSARHEAASAEKRGSDALQACSRLATRQDNLETDVDSLSAAVVELDARESKNSSSVANDLARLANDTASFRAQYKKQTQVLLDQLRACGNEVQRQNDAHSELKAVVSRHVDKTSSDLRKLQQYTSEDLGDRLAKLQSRVASELEGLQDGVANVQERTSRLATVADETNAAAASDHQLHSTQIKTLETMVRRALLEQDGEARRRYEVMARAIQTLADRMEVAAPPLF